MEIRIKNWRDISSYDHIKDENYLSQWAWEFLRRNPDYQKDWLREVESFKNKRKELFSNDENRRSCLGMYGFYEQSDDELINVQKLLRKSGNYHMVITILLMMGILECYSKAILQ
jgi:hypothetical protein